MFLQISIWVLQVSPLVQLVAILHHLHHVTHILFYELRNAVHREYGPLAERLSLLCQILIFLPYVVRVAWIYFDVTTILGQKP